MQLTFINYDVALIKNITTSYDDTTVTLHWNPVLDYFVSHFEIECSFINQNTKHSAQSTALWDNYTAQLSGLTASTSYNCCVSAVLERYSSTTCTQINTNPFVYSEASTAQSVM